ISPPAPGQRAGAERANFQCKCKEGAGDCTPLAMARRVPIARLFALLLAGWIIVATPGRAATEIPFTFRSGMIWLKVEAGGSAAPLAFLLDSGAGKSVLDLAAARRLGLKLGAR